MKKVQEENTQLKADWEEVRRNLKLSAQVSALTNVCVRQEHELKDISRKVLAMEMCENRAYLLIYGIGVTQYEDVKGTVKDFFKRKLKIEREIPIANAYKLGKTGNFRPIKVILQQPQDKGTIFKHVKNLKGLKNEMDKPYRIDDDLPANLQEEHQCLRQIVGKNRKKSTAAQLAMSLKK